MPNSKLFVVGAGGRLGGLVLAALLETVSAARLAALVPYRAQAEKLRAHGIDARVGTYFGVEPLARAFEGVDRLLLIASNDLAERAAHHCSVIDAALAAGVGAISYTSILHADTSPLALARDHRRTETYLRESGIPFVILRNGWFIENELAAVPSAFERGTLLGCSGEGRFAWASLEDYARAAAAVLSADDHPAGRVYELAGDAAHTRYDLAAELSRQAGLPLVYRNLSRAGFEAELRRVGLSQDVAAVLADCDVGASTGALFDEGRELGRLIGRPTTSLAASVAGVFTRGSAPAVTKK